MKKIVYYLREGNFPVTTVTVIQKEEMISRGVAICSPNDQFVKAEGRDLSFLRAEKAFIKERSFGKIRRKDMLIDDLFIFRCEFDPILTDFEMELMKDPESV